jgi:hypothetical protein
MTPKIRPQITRATGAHISVIGHITATELRHHINPVELANGLLNRNADLAGMPIWL